jgi:hypothetical protein
MTGRARDTLGRVTTALECSEHTMLEAVYDGASRHERGDECSEHATLKAMRVLA